MRLQGWTLIALSCAVMSVGCQKASVLDAERADSGLGEHDAEVSGYSDAHVGEPDVNAPFVACEAQTVSRFGPNSSFECDRCGPNGACPEPVPEQGECRCFPEYAGERCELCADGFVEHEGACVTHCDVAGLVCNGLCTGTVDAPACECTIGYDGADCDRCAAGFENDPNVFDALGCIPSCNGECTPEEDCIATSRDEQRCECTAGYARNASGDCIFQGFTADPSFAQGCAHWQISRQVANPTDTVIAQIDSTGLTLSVDHRCSGASAIATAYVPTAHSMPGAAIAISAMGNPGGILHVSFQGPIGPFIIPGGGEPVAGTGDWERYVVCLPVWDRGQEASISFTIGELGTCAEPVDVAFSVRSLELVSDAECENR